MVITRTLDIEVDAARLLTVAKSLVALAEALGSEYAEDSLTTLVANLNIAVQQAGNVRDDIEATVDEYLNEGEDEFVDDDEDDEETCACGLSCGEHAEDCPRAPWNDDDINDDFPLSMEYDEGDDFRNTDSPYE